MLWDRTLARNCWVLVGKRGTHAGVVSQGTQSWPPRGRVQPHSQDLSLNCSERREPLEKNMEKRGGSDMFWALEQDDIAEP